MGVLMEQLGYNVCNTNLGDYEPDIAKYLVERLDAAMEKYNGVQDSPWCSFYKRYAEKYPNMKFVLTTRSLPRWLNSMDAFGNKKIPIWEPVYGKTHYRGNELYFRDFFIRHNKEVLDYFKDQPGRLLVVDIETNADSIMRSIEAFLGLGYTGMNFPLANKSQKNIVRWWLQSSKWRKLAAQ